MSLVIERPSVFYIRFHDWDRLVRCIPTHMYRVYNLYVTFEWLMVYDLESLVFSAHHNFPLRRLVLFFSLCAVPSQWIVHESAGISPAQLRFRRGREKNYLQRNNSNASGMVIPLFIGLAIENINYFSLFT